MKIEALGVWRTLGMESEKVTERGRIVMIFPSYSKQSRKRCGISPPGHQFFSGLSDVISFVIYMKGIPVMPGEKCFYRIGL